MTERYSSVSVHSDDVSTNGFLLITHAQGMLLANGPFSDQSIARRNWVARGIENRSPQSQLVPPQGKECNPLLCICLRAITLFNGRLTSLLK